jgi:hypothetical protein
MGMNIVVGNKLPVDWSSRANKGSYYGCWFGAVAMVVAAFSLFWAVYTYYVPYHGLSGPQSLLTPIVRSSSTPTLQASPTKVSSSSSTTSAVQIPDVVRLIAILVVLIFWLAFIYLVTLLGVLGIFWIICVYKKFFVGEWSFTRESIRRIAIGVALILSCAVFFFIAYAVAFVQ